MENIRNGKYIQLTTENLYEIERSFREEAEKLSEQRKMLSAEISSYRYKAQHIRNLIQRRSKSKYGGEFYVKSEFRKKYGKPFSEFTDEEKRQYQAEYWTKNRDELLAKRRMRYKEKKKMSENC